MAKTKYLKPFPASSLEYMNGQNKIWLNPSYQRDAVWTVSQKRLLIDSLLRDIDIPKLYFRSTKKDGHDFEVVDGQQRLRSLLEYLDGAFALDGDADPVDGHEIAGRRMKDLHMDLQLKLRNATLDVVVLEAGYSDDDIEDTFTRLQNGTPLNAAEKRRAFPGKMRSVVESLADHKIFGRLCGFSDKRFAHEDAVAKGLHLLLADHITDIKPSSIRKTYQLHKAISDDDANVLRLKQSYEFLVKAFKNRPSPKFKKFAMISVPYLAIELLTEYDLAQHAGEFADAYLSFEQRRITNEGLEEDKQDSRLAAYSSAARADRVQDLEYRHETLRREIVGAIPLLALKDPQRAFSPDQRLAIFLRDKGICQECGTATDQAHFHADHKVPFAHGGKTSIDNGQVLCPGCNQKKGKKFNG